MNPNKHTLPRWLLERIALGELPQPLPPSAKKRLDEAGDCAAEVVRLEEENRNFLASHPAERFVPAIQARGEREMARGPKWTWMVALAVPALAAGWVLAVRTVPLPMEALEEGRLKGSEPVLSVFHHGTAGAELLKPGSRLQPGEEVQLRYASFGRRYGVILSIDGGGQVTLHHPGSPAAPPDIEPGGEVLLPVAFRLDAAPSFERFVFVTSSEPFRVEDVLQAARSLPITEADSAALVLGRRFHQSSFTLLKGTP